MCCACNTSPKLALRTSVTTSRVTCGNNFAFNAFLYLEPVQRCENMVRIGEEIHELYSRLEESKYLSLPAFSVSGEKHQGLPVFSLVHKPSTSCQSTRSGIKFYGHYLLAPRRHAITSAALVEQRLWPRCDESPNDGRLAPLTCPSHTCSPSAQAAVCTRWTGAVAAVFTAKSNHMSRRGIMNADISSRTRTTVVYCENTDAKNLHSISFAARTKIPRLLEDTSKIVDNVFELSVPLM